MNLFNSRSGKHPLLEYLLVAVIMLPLSAYAVSSKNEFKVDYIVPALGVWIADARTGVPGVTRSVYMTQTRVSAYASVNDVNFYMSVPLLWTVIVDNGITQDSRIRISDIDLYCGYTFLKIQPRIGFKIPARYSVQGAWIGTRNTMVTAGLAVKPTAIAGHPMTFSGECLLEIPITESNALARLGSLEAFPSIKMLMPIGTRFKGGIEVMGIIQRMSYTWYAQGFYENSFGIVPHVFFEAPISPSTFLTVKAGYGPSFSDKSGEFKRSAMSTNLSVSVGIIP
jgi:hypothetical protein